MAVATVSRPRFSIGSRTLLLVAALAACADQDVPTVSPSEELRPSLAVESSSGAKRKADVGEVRAWPSSSRMRRPRTRPDILRPRERSTLQQLGETGFVISHHGESGHERSEEGIHNEPAQREHG